MTASKTYASNRELGLNVNGVHPQLQHKGSIPASAPGSPHHIVNIGGHIRPIKGQTGWRIRCDQVGTDGGYEFTVGSNSHTVMAGEMGAFDFVVDQAQLLRVEGLGMLAGWAAIVVTRLR